MLIRVFLFSVVLVSSIGCSNQAEYDDIKRTANNIKTDSSDGLIENEEKIKQDEDATGTEIEQTKNEALNEGTEDEGDGELVPETNIEPLSLNDVVLSISNTEIIENNEINAEIGKLSALDKNNQELDVLFSIVEQTNFSIAEDGVTLIALQSLDYEAASSYEVTIEIKDKQEDTRAEKVLTLAVINQSCSDLEGSWVSVPGMAEYNTEDFCLMKYEAKCSQIDGNNCDFDVANEIPVSKPDGTPWVRIDQEEAKSECESIGAGYHLVTNNEWMTVTTNITNNPNNWSGNSIGSGTLNRGHSDNSPVVACAANVDDSKSFVEDDGGDDCTNHGPGVEDDETQKRTHLLSSGEIIWDLAGNIWEYIDFSTDDYPTTNITELGTGRSVEFTLPLIGTKEVKVVDLIPQIAIDNEWNSTQSIGKYYRHNVNADRPLAAMRRGGYWNDNVTSGLFGADFAEPNFISGALGFRCAVLEP